MACWRYMGATVNYSSSFICKYGKGYEMKHFVLPLIAIALIEAWFMMVQADNNKQLIYDLNCSQTAFKILNSQIAEGLCLPKLEGM